VLITDANPGAKWNKKDSPNRLRQLPKGPGVRSRASSLRSLRDRPFDARKGQYGRVIIAGGSERYAGCLTFNALAALRSGADLAIVIAPKRAADIVATHSPDLITVPCKSSFPDPIVVKELSGNADALIVGCGVERTRDAHRALLKIIRDFKGPIVIDAEALHAVAKSPRTAFGSRVLLTPNGGEFEVLAGKPWPISNDERRRSIKSLAKRFGCVVIVKGALDFISDGTRVHIDREGSPYLTKGGYGDLLAGAAGAFMARGATPYDAGKAAAFLIGKAGKLASEKFGEGTLAIDALAEVPRISVLHGLISQD
jgi:ADP-dependent NAD(P)H-hydrate dehydratase / NAD(P)H-hydrate epimerase